MPEQTPGPARAVLLGQQWREHFPASYSWHQRGMAVMPGGLFHDSHYLEPFPLYFERATGAHKWDVDGRRYIDYWMGHGALLLGHSHPRVVSAVAEQVARGTHYGSVHPLAVAWAEQIVALMPAVEMVRFVGSGSEATQLAMRLARAYTGRPKILRFAGHFHGWHDEAAAGGGSGQVAAWAASESPAPQGSTGTEPGRPPGGAAGAAGIPAAAAENTVVVPANDLGAVRQVLAGGEVAAVILEPGGAGWGAVPTTAAFIAGLRELTLAAGTLLIFDEVITGFRLAPGGAQAYYGVRPDLVCLAKVVAGGLPGGAVGGRREILELLAFKDPQWNRERKVAHQGTFNANPLSAAAGVAALEMIATGEPIRQADRLCRQLVEALNQVLRETGVRGCVYGESSMFHIALGFGQGAGQGGGYLGGWQEPATATGGAQVLAAADHDELTRLAKGPRTQYLRRAMLLEGVDLLRSGGFFSAAHTADDVAETVAAFRRALERLARAGLVAVA